MQDIIATELDLRHLVWSEKANTSGTGGCFLKAREETSMQTWYYKVSCYDSYRGVYGHECVNELVAARLMEILGVEHAQYQLVRARVVLDEEECVTWLTRSPSFRAAGERKMALDTFFDMNRRPKEKPLDFCTRMGWEQTIQQMMLVDFLIANRDRHGANIEVLRNKQGDVRLAPLFDNGLSFVFSCFEDEQRAAAFEPLQDVQANNYLGTRSLAENLARFVPASAKSLVGELKPAHKQDLLAGLEGVLPPAHLEKIWEIVWERWCSLD